ncbi:MAG: pilin [Candidatus Paceibacterota bacterium]|jgi:hypothetical protein
MKKIIALIVVAMPSLALAQTAVITDVNSLSEKLVNIGNLATYLLIALAVIYIIWNVVKYMIKPGEDDRKIAGSAIFYGIVGLFIILSIWGLVNILVGTFRTTPVDSAIPHNIPQSEIPRVR